MIKSEAQRINEMRDEQQKWWETLSNDEKMNATGIRPLENAIGWWGAADLDSRERAMCAYKAIRQQPHNPVKEETPVENPVEEKPVDETPTSTEETATDGENVNDGNATGEGETPKEEAPNTETPTEETPKKGKRTTTKKGK